MLHLMKGKNVLLCSYLVGFTKDNQFWFLNYFSISKTKSLANFFKKNKDQRTNSPSHFKNQGFS